MNRHRSALALMSAAILALPQIAAPAMPPPHSPRQIAAAVAVSKVPGAALPRPTAPPHVRATGHGPDPVTAVHPAPGVRIVGPPAPEDPTGVHSGQESARERIARFLSRQGTPPARTAAPRRAPGVPVPLESGPSPAVRRNPSAARVAAAVDLSQLNKTGINRWWEYEEGAIPGVGRWLVNLHWQNLIVQADDMDVPYRGVDLAFRRTYNSLSDHDYEDTDGASEIGQYGQGWTNTFDAHLSTNTCPGGGYSYNGYTGFSVYDVDGARYDYCYDASGKLTPPVGMEGTSLVPTADGGYFNWTKKSGAQYGFYAPYYSGQWTAYSGRMYQLRGRNRNDYLQFSYSWDSGDASTSAHLNHLYVMTERGAMQAALAFSDFGGRRLCSSLTYPDGRTQVTYSYDAAGTLWGVNQPGNSAVGVKWTAYRNYRTAAGMTVSGPRWNAAWNGSSSSDGGYVAFTMGGYKNGQVTGISYYGVMNFTPNDGTGTAYSGVDGLTSPYRHTAIAGYSDHTNVTDSDGHQKVVWIDGLGRPTQRQEYTGSAWLTIGERWDANNDLVAETDANGNETDYAYDANGDTVAVASPQVTTSAGTFRPTQLFDYDANNNVVAYCDAKATHAGGHDWNGSGPPSAGGPDGLCSANGASAHAVFAFTPQTYEPNGQLTAIRSPLGYTRSIRYDTGPQSGIDFGLPTSVAGDPIPQSDGTRSPLQSMVYDAKGNLVCAGTDGSDATTVTVVAYDALNRQVAVGDPDDASLSTGCTKTPGIAGSAIVTRTGYFADGMARSKQTPAEAAANVATQFQYDGDGNVTSEQRHYTSGAGPVRKWYDAEDRLIEVQQPTDPSDFYTFPWSTRYLYDLTQGGLVSVGGSAGFRAYGGLYKTQEVLPAGTVSAQWNESGSSSGPSAGTGNGVWQDTAGTAFDALDRPVATYRNTGNSLIAVSNTYDGGGGGLGQLSQTCNANNECQSFTYDARGQKVMTTFNVGSSTTQSFGYDENGRLATAANGVGSITDGYDADGRKTSRHETVGSVQAAIAYWYYGDGSRKSLDITGGSQSLQGILAYTYRNDGALRGLTVGGSQQFAFSYTGGRRLTSRSDGTGQSALGYTYTGSGSPSSYGLLQGMTAPAFAETGITYNAEGNMVAANSATLYGLNFTNVYTSRGELAQENASAAMFANGTRVTITNSTPRSTPKTGSFAFNVFQGRNAGTVSGNTCVAGPGCENESSWTFGYDNAGRQTSSAYSQATYAPDPPACSQHTNTSAYDAEDHLVQQSLSCTGVKGQNSPQLGYAWGALGHPLRIGSQGSFGSMQYDTLGWDDDTLLFTVTPAGTIDDVKVGSFADYVPGKTNPLTVWERDVNGLVFGCHNAAGYATANPSGFQRNPHFCGYGNSSFSFTGVDQNLNNTVGLGGMLLMPKADGFSDGFNTFQGVRTYDPNAGQWTTPDAYHGDVHDPMSQKPYMWNRNNPYAYSDPSGYAPWWEDVATMLFRLMKGRPPLISSTEKLEHGVFSTSGALTSFGERLFRTFSSMSRMRGNYGFGSVGDVQQANELGTLWTGPGARTMSDGKGLVSRDGSRTYRYPSFKKDGSYQANFQRLDEDGKEVSNGHLNIRGDGINIGPEYFDQDSDLSTGGDHVHLPPGRPL